MVKGSFITFEGPEGSGKTTQIALLRDFLTNRGFEVITTREPGGTSAGDRIRSVLLGNEIGSLEPETELFLMLAQRTEHLRKVIQPAVNQGKMVLCDRYFDSSMAYQGYARGLDPQKIREIHAQFLPGFLPECTVLLQIAPEQGLERARHGGRKQHDRIESEDLDFHRRVYEGYNSLARQEPERFVLVQADGDPLQISKKIIEGLEKRISIPGGNK
ncbi:MAG: hypothetical protein ACD_39C01659G0005 [uncultured bacterium]|nr:MAG: hypothetical protein ACD_39C01659G0005 [uncultured bacterium]